MQWEDQGIVLSCRRQGEAHGRVVVLTRRHGRAAGLVRHVQGKKMQGICQPGNIVTVRWQARLEEHLGIWSMDLVAPVAAELLGDPLRLAALVAWCDLAGHALPERDPVPEYAAAAENWALQLSHAPQQKWLLHHILLEKQILSLLGYGLDLSRCAVSGQTGGLTYLSPRTGRAVTAAAGRPYHDRLFLLPACFRDNPQIESLPEGDLLNGWRILSHFLERWAQEHMPTGMLPASRERFAARLEARLDTSCHSERA